MASTEVTLVGGTVAIVPLDAPANRIVVTMLSGTAGVVYGTADGNLPVVPNSGVEVPDSQWYLPAVLGEQAVIHPPLYGDHMVIPTVRLLSAGTPTVLVSW